MSFKPEQYEVKPPDGSIEPSRFYIINPLAMANWLQRPSAACGQ
jgi:hypothetical protein